MLATLRPRLTYANVMVTALMFIVLGGGAYAAVRLPAASVKSKHIAPDAVKGVDVREASLDPAILQSRIGGSCQEGEAIQSVLASGEITCEAAPQGGGQFDGAAAGGDLTGTYPNPDIALDAVESDELSTNAVGTDEVQPESLGVTDLATYSVGSLEIIDGVVGTADVAQNSLGNDDLAADSVGSSEVSPEGLTGADLAADSVGQTELGTITNVQASKPLAGAANDAISVECPAGWEVISGGGNASHYGMVMIANRRSADGAGNGWRVAFHNNSATAGTIEVHAYCLVS